MKNELVRQWRLLLVAAVPFVALCAVGWRLVFLHFGDHSKLKRDKTITSLGLRGRIFDCNEDQFPMAASLPARSYRFDYKAVNPKHDRREIARAVSEAFQLPLGEVQALFSRTNSRSIPLGVSLSEEVYALLSDKRRISGIRIDDQEVRTYYQDRCMAHVLGFVNQLGIGGAGIEQQYNKFLTGSPGYIRTTVEAFKGGQTGSPYLENVPAIPGADVYLTLDHNIQYEVENAIREVVEQFQASSGWAIVQRVKTGEILALASYPNFAPAKYNEETIDIWRNNAIAIVYEPGSIMKAVAVAAALNERIVTPETTIDVGDGTWVYAGKPLRDHVTGRVSVSTALKKSSNIACAKIGLMLNNQRLEAYLRAFGFGERLGIDLPGEERGILGRAKDWDKLKPTRIPIGQGVAVTGLQMVNAYSTIANDGVMMRPYVVRKVVSPGGGVIYQAAPKVLGRPVRPEVARSVREMLVGVTEEGGTGKRATVRGYSVGGKTGTAQKAVPGGYSSTDYYASFVGFVPAREPVFSVLVSVERPRPQHTGGFVSAPVFARIAAATAQYLAVPPDEPEEEVAVAGRP